MKGTRTSAARGEGAPRRRWRILAVALVLTGLAGCGSGSGRGEEAARDTLTQRQKDSIVGELAVPGAGAVRKALDAADAARARAARHDTLR